MLLALWVLLALLLAVVLFILFTTVHIRIDTENEEYFVRIRGICRFFLDPDEQYAARLLTPFGSFNLSDFKKRKTDKPKKKKPRKKKPRKERSFHSVWVLIKSLFASFKVEEFSLNWDTGDCISNAWLVPVFHLASPKSGALTVNYSGKTELVFSAKNRLIRLLWPLIRFFTQSNKSTKRDRHGNEF